MILGPDGMPVAEPEGEGEKSEGGFWLFSAMNPLKWAIIIAGGLIIIGGVTALIVVLRRRAKKKDMDDDDDF